MTRSFNHYFAVAAITAAGLSCMGGCGDASSSSALTYGELEKAETRKTDTSDVAESDSPETNSNPHAEAVATIPTEPTDDESNANKVTLTSLQSDSNSKTAAIPANDDDDSRSAISAAPSDATGQKPPRELTNREKLDQLLNGSENAEPREVKLLIPEQTFRTEDGALRVSYDDLDLLKVLNMEPVTANAADLMPKWLQDLNGKRIRIRGFMYPTFEETDIEWFSLARDNDICCFRRDPKIYDVFKVILKNGVTTNYIEGRPFDVVGHFHITPKSEDGELYELYRITDAEIIQKR